MGNFITSKDHVLSSHRAMNSRNAKAEGKQRMKEKKHLDEESSSSTNEDSKDKRIKRKREKPKCGYCRGYNYEKLYFKNNLDIMAKLLEENNIDIPYFAIK